MGKKKVLVIDDEAALVDLMAIRLRSNGYNVVSANNGQDGIAKAERQRPDLILLDVMMPEMDGFTVLHRLKNNPATQHIPVVMLTCKGESDSIFSAERLGSTDYLVKPFDTKELLGLLKKYID